jgi:hypothetical protein
MRAHIVVPAELVRAVDSMVGRRARSRFFAEAAAEKLARAKRATLLKQAAGALADQETPGWETAETAEAWVRHSREAGDARLAEEREARRAGTSSTRTS